MTKQETLSTVLYTTNKSHVKVSAYTVYRVVCKDLNILYKKDCAKISV